MPPYSNSDVIVAWGYWRDEVTWAGVKAGDQPATVTFDPVPLTGSDTPNLRDTSARGWLKTRQRVARVDPTTGYFAALLVANNDPDLDAYGGRRVTFSGETPFVVEVPWNTATVAADAAMVAALKGSIPGLTVGASVKAVPLIELALTGGSGPQPPASYLTTSQTLATVATAIDVHDTDPDAHADIRALVSQGGVSDATTTAKGVARLPGGTAENPTVPWTKVTGAPSSYPPSGGAGGVLSGTYPNPGFAVDLATQAELDAVVAAVPEQARDALGAALVAGPNIAIAVNDAADTITVSATSPSGTSVPTRSVNTSTVAVPGELLIVNAAVGERTVTPPLSPALGTFVTVLKSDTSTNYVIWNGATNSDTSAGLVRQWAGATFTWTGSVWAVTSANLTTGGGSNDRADHTGTQAAATISDLAEAVQDIIGTAVVAGTNTSVTYNDAAGTVTISTAGVDAEAVRDTIGATLVGTGNITVTVDDAADTVTISTAATQNSSDAQLRDRSTHTNTQPISTVSGLQSALDAKAGTTALTTHTGDTANPHAVTKGQVGLGNVSNLAPADLPVSTAQQTALDAKAATTYVDAADAARAQRLTVTAVKTGAYTFVAGDYVPADLTSASFTLTLPTGVADGTRVGYKVIGVGGSTVLTVACSGTDKFNRSGGVTTYTASLLGQAGLLQYQASTGLWFVQADDLPLPQLDTRYQPLAGGLTAIAALAPADDALIQRKAGAWTSRTPAQVKSDLVGTGVNVSFGSNGAQSSVTTGTSNTAVGRTTQAALTTGSNNVAVGDNVQPVLLGGSDNVGVGKDALAAATSGSGHVAIGTRALKSLTGNGGCIAIGTDALQGATGGDSNIALGESALRSSGSGSNNTAIGTSALRNTTGTNNVGIGIVAGRAFTSGNGNVAVGGSAGDSDGTTATTAGVANVLLLGGNAQALASNVAVIGSRLTAGRMSLCLGNYGDQLGSGRGVFALSDAHTVPTTNPSGGGVLYSEGGALKWRGSSGTVTVIGAA